MEEGMRVFSSDEVRRRLSLYAVTDRAWLGGGSLEAQVEAALRGGASCIQLREKDMPRPELASEASRIGRLCRERGALFIVNDDVDAALASGADGAHVGQSDMGVGSARAALGEGRILGVSVSTVEEALLAQEAGADYLGVGAIFPTPTKTGAGLVPLGRLKEICEAARIPVVAIGGLNGENLDCLRGTGVSGVALVSAIFGADDVEAACRELRAKADAVLGTGAEGLPDGAGGRAGSALVRGPRGEALEIGGAIFDMDGTLLDSMHIWDDVALRYLLDRGIQPEEGLVETFRAMSLREAALHYRDVCGVPESAEAIEAGIIAMVEDFYVNEALPKPGVARLLEGLRQRGVAMCVATATEKRLAEAALDRCGLTGYFSFVLTCGEVGRGKDSPKIFEEALGRLGTPRARTAVVEDAAHALVTARGAGFPTIGVYDRSYEDFQAEIRGNSSVYVTSLEELAAR
jgi:thiamine-phosphate pyrophosphorylase